MAYLIIKTVLFFKTGLLLLGNYKLLGRVRSSWAASRLSSCWRTRVWRTRRRRRAASCRSWRCCSRSCGTWQRRKPHSISCTSVPPCPMPQEPRCQPESFAMTLLFSWLNTSSSLGNPWIVCWFYEIRFC